MNKSENNKPFKFELSDRDKQTELTDMIEMDQDSIDDCLQFMGMDKSKWEDMWGTKK